VKGEWDLRSSVSAYLGGVDFGGKRVLELGTADGYLSFHIERGGAKEVVSYDLSRPDELDLVPFARASGSPVGATGTEFSELVRRMNNAYWLAHRAYGSRARLVHGDVYSVPLSIGPVDISVFGAILLHTRDPFGAMTAAVRLTRETVVVTEALGLVHMPVPFRRLRALLPPELRRPAMRFMPDWRTSVGPEGWWRLSPEVVQEFLGVLGFEDSKVSTHFQRFNGRRRQLFTVVARRTHPNESPDGFGRS
jgi:hypothetical protein